MSLKSGKREPLAMTQESQSISAYLPHLTTLAILLVLEYWTLMSHGASLVGAGSSEPVIGIPFLLAIVLIVVIVFGFYSICNNRPKYERIVSLSLILFVIQMAFVFIEYVVLATGIL